MVGRVIILPSRFLAWRNIVDDIKLVIDSNTLIDYERIYFKLHPKATKKPIETPYHTPMNQWMIMKRPMMNALKQRWKDFIIWFIKKQGYSPCDH